MSAPFVAMAAAVDVIRTGPDLLEARGRQISDLLGTAQRLWDGGEPIGWLVSCGQLREFAQTTTTARFVLLNAASNLDGVR